MGEQAQGLCGELCGSRAAAGFQWLLWFCVFSCSRAPRSLAPAGVNLLEEKKVKPQRFILKTLLYKVKLDPFVLMHKCPICGLATVAFAGVTERGCVAVLAAWAALG